jgi:2-oxoglutarate/2-oxoacid ferredoxin oxidoreductase subunit alpha
MTVLNDMTIVLGGDAGQGMESSGAGLAKALTRAGLHVFAGPDYHSRIRGGHNFYTVRVAPKEIAAHRSHAELLLALTKDTVTEHAGEMSAGAGVLFDPSLGVDEAALRARGLRPMPVPVLRIGEDSGDKMMANTALLGAAAGVTGWGLTDMEEVIRQNFGRKSAALAESNLKAAAAGHDFAKAHYGAEFPWRLKSLVGSSRLTMGGSQSICLGAVAAGCRFAAGYPMTPATPIMEWWASHASKYGLVFKHAEDEIAAINMAIGANYVGARAMTASSGGGFSLMVEALGLAGMVEVPLVVIEAQRAGPSTAMATRTEQGDLLFMLHAAQGEFLRIVMAPGTVEQSFECGWRAFNLAEQFQTPVIVVIDQFVAHFIRSVDKSALDFGAVRIDRGALLTVEELDELTEPYVRYAITPGGVSPRAVPGHPKAVYSATSDEHSRDSHMDESSENRVAMQRKRLAKTAGALAEMAGPTVYGPADASLALVCWGSTYGPVHEAVDELNATGTPARMVHFCDVWPFPAAAAERALVGARRILAVEGNLTGQFAWLLRAETGIKVHGLVSRFDGRPFTVEDILAGVQAPADN